MSVVSVEDYQLQLMDLSGQLLSLESVDSGLSVIYGDLVKNGIKRTDAQYLHQMDPDMLPHNAPVNSFTVHPSKTNLKVALEAISGKRAGIIAALVAALAAFVYKIYKWITGTDSGEAPTAGTAENIQTSQEKVVATVDKMEGNDNFKELGQHVNQAYRELVKNAQPGEPPNELTDQMMDHNSDFSKSFKHILESTIPKLHGLIEATVRHYNELAKRPGGSPEMRELDSPETTVNQLGLTMSTLDKGIMEAMKALSMDMDALKITAPNRDAGDLNARKILAKASQLHAELQAMTQRPTHNKGDLDLVRFKASVNENVLGNLFTKLNETTERLQTFVNKEARDELLSSTINWPGDIQSNPELFVKAQKIYENYRQTIHDLTAALSKLYVAIKFAGDTHVRYMQKMNQILLFSDKEFAAQQGK